MNATQLRETLQAIQTAGSAADIDRPRDEVLEARLRNTSAKEPITLRGSTSIERASEFGKKVGDREVAYVMSSAEPCGYWRDVVPAKAWDIGAFKKRKAPLLWMHGREGGATVGTMRNLRKNHDHNGQKVLAGIARFMDEGLDERTDGLVEIIRAGFMDAGSVGFEIKSARLPTPKDVEEFGLDIEGDHRYTTIVEKAELIEFSIVPVGADPNAMAIRDVNDDGIELGAFLDQLVENAVVSPQAAREMRLAVIGAESIDVRSTPEEAEPSEGREHPGTGVPMVGIEGETLEIEGGPEPDGERTYTDAELDELVDAVLRGDESTVARETEQQSAHADCQRAEALTDSVLCAVAKEIRTLRGDHDNELHALKVEICTIRAALGLPPKETTEV